MKEIDLNDPKFAHIKEKVEEIRLQELAERQKLTLAWQAAYPEAAKEQSPVHHPLMKVSDRDPDDPPEYPDEIWCNDVYQVTLRRRSIDPVFGSAKGCIQLGISAMDNTARHDWREFQAIKNQLAGPECEAFELYPAQSREMDPSNYYALWCFPGIRIIRVGSGPEIAKILDADQSYAPQRGFPKVGLIEQAEYLKARLITVEQQLADARSQGEKVEGYIYLTDPLFRDK